MSSNEMRGRKGVRVASQEYDLVSVPDTTALWYDAKNPRTGAKYEVKSAATDGMFRFWADQNQKLTAADLNGTSWYVLVVLDSADRKRKVRRVKPSTVTKVVSRRGGWNKRVHRRGQKQKKVPVDVFF